MWRNGKENVQKNKQENNLRKIEYFWSLSKHLIIGNRCWVYFRSSSRYIAVKPCSRTWMNEWIGSAIDMLSSLPHDALQVHFNKLAILLHIFVIKSCTKGSPNVHTEQNNKWSVYLCKKYFITTLLLRLRHKLETVSKLSNHTFKSKSIIKEQVMGANIIY